MVVALKLLVGVMFAIIATSSFAVMLSIHRDRSSELRFFSFGSPVDGVRATLVLERTDEGVKVGGEL